MARVPSVESDAEDDSDDARDGAGSGDADVLNPLRPSRCLRKVVFATGGPD